MTREDSSVKRLVVIMAAIFLAEYAIMLLLHSLPLPESVEALIDAFLLVMILFPALYRLVLSPLLREITVRKRGEELLRQSKEDWEDTFNSITDMVTVHDRDMHIVWANRTAKELLDLPSLDEYKANCCGFFHGEADSSPTGCPARRSLATGDVETMEIFVPHLNRHFDVTVIPRFDSCHHVTGLIHVARDVTDSKKAEAALQESEERYRHLVEQSPEAMAVHDGSEFLYINAAGAELLGVATPGELIGRAINDFIHPDYVGTIADQTKRIKKTGRSETFLEEKFCCLDGSVIDVEVVSTFVAYRGEPAVQAIVHNVTERKGAERKLAKTYAKLRERKAFIESIVSNLQSGIIVTDLAMRVKLANPYAINCFDGMHVNLNGRELRMVCPEMDESIASGADCAEIGVHRASADIIIGYNRFDLKGFDNAVVGNIISFVDLTEIVKIRSEMKLKERLATMGEVVAQVAHEMRNPLFGMTAVGQILDMELQLTPAQKQLMNSFLKEARRLNNLVEELLVSTKELTLRKKTVNLKSIIDASIAATEIYAQEKGVHIVKQMPDQQVLLMADPEKIEQVILNLLKNAVDASASETEIQLVVETDDDNASMKVIDSGRGIPEELQDKIFDIFFTTKRHGTGMGLSISKNIVEGHGGMLTVRNNAGKGATFTVILPLTGVTDESIGY